MASPEQDAKSSVLHFARNGANRPLHQDRQVLRAGDLSLEQVTQDAMLARARRYLHGWGVVAGFVPSVKEKGDLAIGPGYGVTPLGDELFLPETVSLPDAAKAVLRSCGPGPIGCEVIDVKVRADAHDAARQTTVTAWLIARPASREAAPRPGVPEDCAHPASTLLPSRRCGGVEFAILCSLPPSQRPKLPDCNDLMPFVCGNPRIETPPLPWETPFAAADNFLAIAELTLSTKGFTATAGSRRRLWPVSLIQEWIASCLCPVLDKPTRLGGGVIGPNVIEQPPPPVTPPIGPNVIEQPPPRVTPPIGPNVIEQPPPRVTPPIGPGVIEQPPHVTPPIRGGAIVQPQNPVQPPPDSPPSAPPLIIEEPQDRLAAIRERLTESVTEIAGVGTARARLLADAGIRTEGEFVTASTSQIAEALSLSEETVTEMKEEVNARHNLGLSFR